VEKDREGRIVSVHYGKIYHFDYGESLDHSGRAVITISSYFNPTPNDRNLEADALQNVMTGQKSVHPEFEP